MSFGASFGLDERVSSHHVLTQNKHLPMWPSSTFFSFLTMAAKRGSEQPPPSQSTKCVPQGPRELTQVSTSLSWSHALP